MSVWRVRILEPINFYFRKKNLQTLSTPNKLRGSVRNLLGNRIRQEINIGTFVGLRLCIWYLKREKDNVDGS